MAGFGSAPAVVAIVDSGANAEAFDDGVVATTDGESDSDPDTAPPDLFVVLSFLPPSSAAAPMDVADVAVAGAASNVAPAVVAADAMLLLVGLADDAVVGCLVAPLAATTGVVMAAALHWNDCCGFGVALAVVDALFVLLLLVLVVGLLLLLLLLLPLDVAVDTLVTV